MKKCPRCRVIYKRESQFKCLYCDGSLLEAKEADFEGRYASAFDMSRAKEMKFKDNLTNQRKMFLMNIFFQGSPFLSSYRFNLRDFRKGTKTKRFLINPLNVATFVNLPWFLVTLAHSAIYRLLPKSYCARCGYQFVRTLGSVDHDPRECAYNQEYDLITREVFSGKVFIDLDPIHQISEEKVRKGERSALSDLLNRRTDWEKALDILSITASIVLYVYLLASFTMPIFNKIYQFDTP